MADKQHDRASEPPSPAGGAARPPEREPQPTHTVRLPRFVRVESVGLGTVIKRATTAVGVKPCGACEERAARLNRFIGFERRP